MAIRASVGMVLIWQANRITSGLPLILLRDEQDVGKRRAFFAGRRILQEVNEATLRVGRSLFVPGRGNCLCSSKSRWRERRDSNPRPPA
jgi:hypothetical protein